MNRYARALAVLTLLLAVAVGASLYQPKRGLELVYQRQADSLRGRLSLSDEQTSEIRALLNKRMQQERHLRRQMRTTYTPQQQQQAALLWRGRDGRMLSTQERRIVWDQLGATAEQRRQFEAYLAKLQEHREETMYLVAQLLEPRQQTSLTELAFEP